MSLDVNLMRTPGVTSFLQTLRQELAKPRSLLLLLPASIRDNEAWLTLINPIEADIDVVSIELGELAHDEPIAALGKELCRQRGWQETPRTYKGLLETPMLPDVLCLLGLDALEAQDQEKWLNLLMQWAKASQGRQDRGTRSMALCVPAQSRNLVCPLPEPDVFLSVRRWLGIPSALDMRLLCRLHHADLSGDPLAQWREYLLPALAASDASLAAFLWDKLETSSGVLIAALQCYGESKGWTQTCLKAWGTSEFLAATHQTCYLLHDTPRTSWLPLWANDVLCYTPEQGWELHVSALTMLEETSQVIHRIWKGQAALLLPRVDAIRLKICQYLTDSYGGNWPLWHPPKEDRERQTVQQNPLACGLGHLEASLRCCPTLRGEYRWRTLILEALQIRNQIAHYQPVTFESYRRLEEVARCI